jgi:AcrR family transcriptional regulator
MPRGQSADDTKDRLLLAAAQLMHESGDRSISTRAVCGRAGVEAPTLYYHFGSKQGLIDAVIEHGFTQYVDPEPTQETEHDPVEAIRLGWDRHVRFGLENPRFYALLYGNVERGRPCAITSAALARLTDLLTSAARTAQLRVAPADAALQLLAANLGVTLTLIAQPEEASDLALSDRVREAALAGVLAERDGSREQTPEGVRRLSALALCATLDEGDVLSPGERALLRELLERLAGQAETDPAAVSRRGLRNASATLKQRAQSDRVAGGPKVDQEPHSREDCQSSSLCVTGNRWLLGCHFTWIGLRLAPSLPET